MSNMPMSIDYAMLAELARRDNKSVGGIGLPILKMNYQSHSIHPLGSWVLGQKISKEKIIIERTVYTPDGKPLKQKIEVPKIEDEGKLVTKIIIMTHRNKCVYIDNDTPNTNCFSPIFEDFETVYGNRYKTQCSKSCPYRDKSRKVSCKFNKVLFVIALVETQGQKPEKIECMMYLKGASFTPTTNYLKTSEIADGASTKIPYYSFITFISSEPEMNGSIQYYKAVFNKGNMLSMNDIQQLSLKVPEIDNLIIKLNNSAIDLSDESDKNYSQTSQPIQPQSSYSGTTKDFDQPVSSFNNTGTSNQGYSNQPPKQVVVDVDEENLF